MQSELSLIPFHGGLGASVLAGITPPTDKAGCLLDLRTPDASLDAVRGTLGATDWPAHWLAQVHGAEVLAVDSYTSPGLVGRTDALVTNRPGVLLLTRHADCPVLLVWDPVRSVLGLAHSGRRGSLANITHAVVTCMAELFGSVPEQITASIGPGIRRCCYEVGKEVLEEAELVGHHHTYFEHRDGRIYMDLQGLIGDQLRSAGVQSIHGETEAECTHCGPSGLHSYRRDGTNACFAAAAGILP